tara:strand:+ start:3445 stop:3975 length:531 start_codon:yes stop_codon:yes gene_type:complete
MLSNRIVALAVGVAMCLTFVAATPKAVSNIDNVLERQIASNQRLQEWKAAYQALLPVNSKWETTFTSSEETSDLVELYRAFRLERHGLRVNADTIVQTGSYPVDVEGIQVGLQKLCIGNNQKTLKMSARNISTLRQGIRAVAKRNDITMGSVSIGFDRESTQPFAEISDFCLKVRS